MKVRRSLPGKRCSRWKGFDCRVSEMDQGAMKLVPDLAKAFGSVSQLCGLGRRILFSPGRCCGCKEVTSSTRAGYSVQVQTTMAILPGSKWSCLLLRILLHDALREQ